MLKTRAAKLLRRFGRVLLAAMVAASVGLHWPALQTVAWTKMVFSYSRNVPLGEAFKRTFSGDHPCKLCKAVGRGQRNEEQKTGTQDFKKKLDPPAVIGAPVRLPAPVTGHWQFPEQFEVAVARKDTPPAPPPRV